MNMRNCFVTKDSMLAVCGKCGKEMLNREWWLKDHANACHFRKQDLTVSLSEEEFVYHLSVADDGLCLSLYTPRLCRRMDGKKGFQGAEWKKAAEIIICKDHKEIKELMNESGLSLDEILTLIDQEKLTGFQSDYLALIQTVFPMVLKYDGLKTLLDCYMGHGFIKKHPDPAYFQAFLDGTWTGFEVLAATHKYNPVNRFKRQYRHNELVYINQLHELAYGEEKYLHLNLTWMKRNYVKCLNWDGRSAGKPRTTYSQVNANVIVGDRFFFTDKYIPFDTLAFCTVDFFLKRLDRENYRNILSDFDLRFPQYHLGGFMKEGNNPLLPFIAPYNDKKLELMTKAGLGSITCHLSADHWIFKNPLNLETSKGPANSFQALFGLPYKYVSKFRYFNFDRDLYISFLKAVDKEPDLLAGSKISRGMIELIGKNQPDYECEDKIRDFDQYTKKQILRMARFLDKKNISYADYLFYLNHMTSVVEEEGLTPRYFKDMLREIKIYQELNRNTRRYDLIGTFMDPDYRELATVNNIEDKQELAGYTPKYLVYAPKTAYDVLAEGIKMHNCVGTYLSNIREGYSKIYFLRETKRPLKSLCTIEVDRHNELVQVKAFANRFVPDEIQKFVCAWAELKQVKYSGCSDITVKYDPEEMLEKIGGLVA